MEPYAGTLDIEIFLVFANSQLTLSKPVARTVMYFKFGKEFKTLGVSRDCTKIEITSKSVFWGIESSFKGFSKIKDAKKKIMVTHVHPTGTKMEKFTHVFPGSKGVQKAIERFKPDILLCSHVHEAEGIEEKIGNTLVINVGKKGKIIEI